MQIVRKIREVDRRRKVSVSQSVSRILLAVSLTLSAGTAMAQANLWPYVQHVIIVIQENRTPDDLFNQDSTLIANGAHVQPPSNIKNDNCTTPSSYQALQATPFYTCWDPDHSHGLNADNAGAWNAMWDNGNMDGACKVFISWKPAQYCNGVEPTCINSLKPYATICPYAYVQNTQWDPNPPYYKILDPYFQIANQYGFANYMFQTNQGPSFPAHQFLLSGTSAPVSYDHNDGCSAYDVLCYEWFAAENNVAPDSTWGCTTSDNIFQIDTNGAEYQYQQGNGIYNNGVPCYDHPTLVDLLDNAQPNPITWKYYARSAAGLWTAPSAIKAICGLQNGKCNSNDWNQNVAAVFPDQGGYGSTPILDDIANCNLSNVSWVIPDGNWSDHAGQQNSPGDAGPSYVAAIVNAIGNSYAASNGKCDYWATIAPETPPAEPTVILVVWDDWGGWYDDVVPPDCPGPGQCTGYSNLTGGQYVYGFRVPLLVVGAYTKNFPNGYISGPDVGSSPNCTPPSYCHDFGSILNFIEYAFGTGGNPLGGTGGISPNYLYADRLVMDQGPPATPYSLYDFFNFSPAGFHSFQTILGAKYPPGCFTNPNQTGCFYGSYPQDPDDDASE